MRISDTSDLWWKTAVVYCLDVQTFMDWNDDGMGDLQGLVERIDYLADLGVTCLWLMPFYPTTDRDDGYDITDYYGVDPRLGSSGDFVEVVRTARDRGMRVIIDLVLNHTSDRHPWFRAARRSPKSPYRDYYVWRDRPAAGHRRPGGLPGQGGQRLGVRRQGRRVVLPPLLPDPARPQHHQPGRARRDPQDDGLLARARDLGVPGRRRAVHDRDRGRRRGGSPRLPGPARLPAGAARLRRPADRGRDPARRGQPAAQGPEDVLRQRRGRRADDAVRLHRHAEPLPLTGPRRTLARWPAPWPGGRPRPGSRSGRRSCATTTS